MTYSPGSTVLVGPGIGSIEHAYPNGYAYDVRLTTGATMIVTASAMKPAPSNVVLFPRRDHYWEMYDL